MAELLLLVRWALLAIGLVYFVTESLFFMPGRALVQKLGRLLTAFIYCPACTGFWLGALLGFANLWPWGSDPYNIAHSAIASMALATTWSKLTGGNPMYELEVGSG